MPTFERTFFDYLETLKRELRVKPLILGGAASSGGGSGGPAGGFIGFLPQTRVTYDQQELGLSTTTASGASLWDNLNHIRYRLDVLESGGALSVYYGGSPVVDPSIRLDLYGDVTVSDAGGGVATVVFPDPTLFIQTANATVSNTVSETTLVGTGVGSATLPANFFTVGKTLRLTMRGINSTATPAGTLTFRIKLGATTIISSAAETLTNGLTDMGWDIQADITCRTTGSSGTVRGQGKVFEATGTGTSAHWMLASTSDTTINTTVSNAVDITVEYSTADASNSISATNFTIEVIN